MYYVWLDEYSEAEGIDRNSYGISQNQIDLFNKFISIGKKVVVILHCGCSVDIQCAHSASSIIWAGLSGQAGAEAVVNILEGKINPSGKLAETWWKSYDDCPTSNNELFPGDKDDTNYKERLFVGYRGIKDANKPEYTFGFGLSYTKFEYKNIEISSEGVKFFVKNIGEIDGKETSFIFYSKKNGIISRPLKQLCAFKKIELKAGEKKQVEINFSKNTFDYFDQNEKSWQTEKGKYIIEIGSSYEDIRLSCEIDIQGIIPKPEIENKVEFNKKEKINKRNFVNENTVVIDLKYARGWTGRLFSWSIIATIKITEFFGKKSIANTLRMGILNQPIRGFIKCGGMTKNNMDGLILIFNGHFFKGLNKFLKKHKENK